MDFNIKMAQQGRRMITMAKMKKEYLSPKNRLNSTAGTFKFFPKTILRTEAILSSTGNQQFQQVT